MIMFTTILGFLVYVDTQSSVRLCQQHHTVVWTEDWDLSICGKSVSSLEWSYFMDWYFFSHSKPFRQQWVFVYRHWIEENEMVFVSHKVPFTVMSGQRSWVAGNGTEWEVKTIVSSSPTSGGEQWAFVNFLNFIKFTKTVPISRKVFSRNFPDLTRIFPDFP